MNYKQKEKLNEETNNKFLKQIEELNINKIIKYKKK